MRTDDLPRFEGRFKELLNENTVREIANSQSQLRREQQSIRERVEIINKSLHEIDHHITGSPAVTETGRHSRNNNYVNFRPAFCST